MAENMQERGSHRGEEAGEATASAVSSIGNRISDYSTQAKEYARKGYQLASDKATKIKGTTEDYIVDNPWYAVGIALGVGAGVGLVLGLLIRSGSRGD